MLYYAVIDTNVIVSAMMNPDSIPGNVLKHALGGRIIPLINQEILDEYIRVIHRSKFGFDENDIKNVLLSIKERAVVLDRTISNEPFIDQNDIVFYEITLTGRIDKEAYLVTGNMRHFPKKPFVVSPKEMMDIIESN